MRVLTIKIKSQSDSTVVKIQASDVPDLGLYASFDFQPLPGSAQGLLQALYSGITPGGA